jgi:hypothetical protein
MIATAWDYAPEPKQEADLPLQSKLHIERLQLSEKIEKLKIFITMNSEFKALNYRHSRLLEEQLASMQMYEGVLVQRMAILNNPNQN